LNVRIAHGIQEGDDDIEAEAANVVVQVTEVRVAPDNTDTDPFVIREIEAIRQPLRERDVLAKGGDEVGWSTAGLARLLTEGIATLACQLEGLGDPAGGLSNVVEDTATDGALA
jgi:hypothetical protein